jgi:carbonic anhydrase
MKQLIDGISKFRREVFPEHSTLFSDLVSAQHPDALFITCADSRIDPNMITQTKPGDLFICRTVGNLVPPYGESDHSVSSAIEYAVTALNVPNIIVCGHSDCGAMKALLKPESLEKLPQTRSWLRYGHSAREVVHGRDGLAPGTGELSALVEQNVITQLEHLKTHPCVAARLARGQLQLYGLVYKIHSGEVSAYDAVTGSFSPVDGRLPSATPHTYLQLLTKEVA